MNQPANLHFSLIESLYNEAASIDEFLRNLQKERESVKDNLMEYFQRRLAANRERMPPPRRQAENREQAWREVYQQRIESASRNLEKLSQTELKTEVSG
jgi:hypothetical protein